MKWLHWRCVVCGMTGGALNTAGALAAHERGAFARPHQAQLVLSEAWAPLEPEPQEEETLP